jgi:peptidoglycan/LPS O-acetylase OafA/YrhL
MSARLPPNSGSHGLTYQPALDGIRALAVAAVLAFHADMPWARGGFLGVDAFFVLSGFLITSLLLVEWRRSESINLLAFWARRARRLLPALFLMLLGVAFYAVAFAGPLELGGIRGDAVATIAYVANWRPVFAGQSYFDQFITPSPLRHTWSLGIEEQYYMIWPLLLVLLLAIRRVSVRTLTGISVALLISSAVLMAVLFHPGHDPSRVYYGTDTRAQSLLVGAVLAMVLPRLGLLRGPWATRILQAVAVACVAGIGWAWVRTESNSILLYRGGFFMLATGVAIVIAASVQPKAGPVGRALSLPPLRWLGLISYGVYLWHWPIYLMLSRSRTGWDPHALFALRVAVTLLVATASYRLIELPVRRGAFRQWKVSWTLAPATAGCIALALFLVTRGAFSPVTTAPMAMPRVEAASVSRVSRVMVIGDSLGMSLEPGLTQVAQGRGLTVWNRSRLYCGFLPGDMMIDFSGNPSADLEAACKDWRRTWPSDVQEFRPDLTLMLFGSWDYPDHVVNGVTLETGTPEWNTYVLDELQAQLDSLTAQGGKLALLTWPYPGSKLWKEEGQRGTDAEQDAHRRLDHLNALYRQFAEDNQERVMLIDLNAFASPEGKYSDLVIDGVRMREDGIHFTPESSYIVANWLVQQIIEEAAGINGVAADNGTWASEAPTRVMVLGDSLGMSLEPGLSEVGKDSGLSVWNPSIVMCGFVSEDSMINLRGETSERDAARCNRWRGEWPSAIGAFDPDVVVMVFGAWDYRDHVVNGVTLEAGTAEWNAYVLSELERERVLLSSQGAKLVLLTWPCQRPTPWTEMGSAGVRAEEDSLQQTRLLNGVYKQFAVQHPADVEVIDLYGYACPEDKYTDLAIDGVKMREDGTHFTQKSSYVVARWLVPQIVEAATLP